jgi:hypothetical protein
MAIIISVPMDHERNQYNSLGLIMVEVFRYMRHWTQLSIISIQNIPTRSDSGQEPAVISTAKGLDAESFHCITEAYRWICINSSDRDWESLGLETCALHVPKVDLACDYSGEPTGKVPNKKITRSNGNFLLDPGREFISTLCHFTSQYRRRRYGRLVNVWGAGEDLAKFPLSAPTSMRGRVVSPPSRRSLPERSVVPPSRPPPSM